MENEHHKKHLILILIKNVYYPTSQSNAGNSFSCKVVDGLAEAINNLFQCLKDFVFELLCFGLYDVFSSFRKCSQAVEKQGLQ